jgi:CheY-like chemotaxis protein
MRVNRLVLGRMLQLLGFEVIEAENGKAALEQFLSHQESLCCVVLDLQMPVLDGWETAKQLRGLESQGTRPRLPIVGCTALQLQDTWKAHCTVEDSALRCGFDEVMVRDVQQQQESHLDTGCFPSTSRHPESRVNCNCSLVSSSEAVTCGVALSSL